jgi:hypothetical protein
MKIVKSVVTLLAALFMVAMFVPRARASAWDQLTRVTFNNPVQVPGNRVLGPGTYWLMLPRVGATVDFNDVLVYNANRTQVVAILPTVRATRSQQTAKTVFTFAEQRNYNPDALMKWFYPGLPFGQQFVYSSHKQHQLNRETAVNSYGHVVSVG